MSSDTVFPLNSLEGWDESIYRQILAEIDSHPDSPTVRALRERVAAQMKPGISVPVTVWTGINPWFVAGDGITEPISVCTTDASGTEVGFLPFGYALPGMLLRQAEGLRDMLNQARAQHDAN